MALVDKPTLDAVDLGLQIAGVACAVASGRRLLATGQWRSPLGSPGPAVLEPSLLAVLGVASGYVLLTSLLLRLVPGDPSRLDVPGSSSWHMAQSLDACAKLAMAVVMMRILHRARRAAPQPADDGARPARLSAWHTGATALAATLILFPLCYSQLYAAKALWSLLDPAANQPRHAAIEALQNSEWGLGGLVQLALLAVVVAPLAEEWFFRGLLLGAIRRASGLNWPAIVASGVAFGLIHHSQPQDIVPLATMGVFLGVLRVRYGSLSLCAMVHALFNLRTVAFVILNPEMAAAA